MSEVRCLTLGESELGKTPLRRGRSPSCTDAGTRFVSAWKISAKRFAYTVGVMNGFLRRSEHGKATSSKYRDPDLVPRNLETPFATVLESTSIEKIAGLSIG